MADRAREWWRSLGSRRVRAALLAVLIVGGVARVAWVAHAGVAPPFASDPQAYLLQGETIARGEGYSNPLIDIENVIRRQKHQPPLHSEPAAFYPPGYPVFIAAVTWTVWHTPIPDRDLVRTIEYVQAALGVLSILLAFLIARRVFDTRVALLAAAVIAVYPNLITTTATLQFETVFITLLLLTALALLHVATREDPRTPRLVATGVLIGSVALMHPTVTFLVAGFLAARLVMRRPARETVRAVAVLTATTLVVIMPWTIRNYVQLHTFLPLATSAGPALCMARNPEATGSIDIGVLERQCQPQHVAASQVEQSLEANRYSTSHALRWVREHPLSEVKMWFTRTHLAYRRDTSGLDAYAPNMTRSKRHLAVTLSDDVSFVVLGLAVVGVLATIAKRRRPATVFLIVATGALAAVPIILFGDPRYRVPAEPFFAVLAAAGVFAVIDGVRRPRRASTAT